ncbi:hypothetical protein TW95_gp1802 [Pandoravirus inopinatum]|uniref:Uncharacterized protein n=1 Tax=Pandoravirus inopinatum TaxID=1605721 RepID=A0A0B5JBX4_9VIRU|nr:hypothetical protein TW95_gp1802 [Pandoravirus inopinatum]AJF98536.1 hypothetical protein [Pandoravirus inopinatum]
MWVLSFVPAVHGRLTFFSFLLITRLKKAHQWRVDPSTHRPKANEKNATALKPRGSLACLPVPQCVGRLPLGSLVGRPFFCLLRPTCGIGRQNIKTPKKHQQANMGVGSGLGFAIARFLFFFRHVLFLLSFGAQNDGDTAVNSCTQMKTKISNGNIRGRWAVLI